MMTVERAGILSGLAWGLVAGTILFFYSGFVAMAAIPVGPLIGRLVTVVSQHGYRRSPWFLIPISIVTLIAAAALCGATVGFLQGLAMIPTQGLWIPFAKAMNLGLAVTWGIVFLPLYWVLFVAAYLNHRWIRGLWQSESGVAVGPAM